MKITKTKEVITEEIEVEDGLYFISIGYKGDDSPYEFYKVNINRNAFGRHTGYAQIDYTFVRNDEDDSCIRTKSSYDNFLPFDVNQFFLQDFSAEKEYKEITEEEFEQQKQEVIKRITDVNK